MILVVLVQGQAVTQGKNKLPHGQYTSDPNIFTDSGPPIKRPIGGLIKGAPDPPYVGVGRVNFCQKLPNIPAESFYCVFWCTDQPQKISA